MWWAYFDVKEGTLNPAGGSRSYLMVYSVNEGEGYSQASASSAQQMMHVRRLTTPKGVGTGLVFKDAQLGAGGPSALLQHIEHISHFGLAP